MTAKRFEVVQGVEISNTTKHALEFDTYMDRQGTIRVVVKETIAPEVKPEETETIFTWEEAQVKLRQGYRLYCTEWDTNTVYVYMDGTGRIRLRGTEDHLKDYPYENIDGDDTWKFFEIKGARP